MIIEIIAMMGMIWDSDICWMINISDHTLNKSVKRELINYVTIIIKKV